MAGGTVDADFGVASVFPVSVPSGGAVGQGLEFWAEQTVIILIIYILPPFMATLPGLRPLVSGGQHTSIFKYLLADMRRLVSGVGNNGLRFRESRCYTVIDLIKGHAAMYISGGNNGLQNKTMLVTGRVGLIGKPTLERSLDKRAAVRIGHAPLHGVLLLLRGIIPALLCWCRRCVIVIKRLLSVGLPVRVYLLHQFLRVMPECRGYLYLHPFFRVGIGLDVHAVYKNCLGGEISRLRHFLQDPTEYLIYCLLGKPVPEIINSLWRNVGPPPAGCIPETSDTHC